MNVVFFNRAIKKRAKTLSEQLGIREGSYAYNHLLNQLAQQNWRQAKVK